MIKLKRKFDYKHILCMLITAVFIVVMGVLFENSLYRIIDSLIDLFWSTLFYFCKLFRIKKDITVTVNDISPFSPSIDFPATFAAFKQSFLEFWSSFFSKASFVEYFSIVVKILYVVAIVVAVALVPIIIIFYLAFKLYFSKQNNDYNKDSKALTICKRLSAHTVLPVRTFFKSFYSFVKEHKAYYMSWFIILLICSNAFTIFIEFIAYYLYFAMSFDVSSLYIQVYKLILDLAPFFSIIPLPVWIIVGVIVYFYMCRNIGYARLNNYERRDRGFINERPIVSMVCGTMGKKKTTILTDMALSQEVMFRDKAFEKILENDLKFPNFPWINLENYIKASMKNHVIYNLASCKKTIRLLKFFYTVMPFLDSSMQKACRRHIKKRLGIDTNSLLFDYNVLTYPTSYYDGLVVTNIWDTVETYAQLYFIYIIQSSLLVSNYSVRVDCVLSDIGNFPLWNTDFFRRDGRLAEAFSRHAHILDFDMLRLGKKVIENNSNVNGFEFGIVLITEVGKERGNNLELKDVKKADDGANQKNDLFNSWLKMCRHSATVDNFPFIKVFTDEQRPESWGADARDLCELVFIKDNGDINLAMPGLSLFELVYSFLFNKFERLYYQYRYNRSDNTLFMSLYKKCFSKIHHLYKRLYNTFGYSVSQVQVESGTQDGERHSKKYYLMSKKIYSKRFSTDCFSDFFNRKAIDSHSGIIDIGEYKYVKASLTELQTQNSYFIRDLMAKAKTRN